MDGGQECHGKVVVCRLVAGLVLPQRDPVEVTKEIVEVLCPLLVV